MLAKYTCIYMHGFDEYLHEYSVRCGVLCCVCDGISVQLPDDNPPILLNITTIAHNFTFHKKTNPTASCSLVR